MKKITDKLVSLSISLVLALSIFGMFPAGSNAETCQIEMRRNSKVAFACDKAFKLDVAPFEQDGSFFVPVRFFFERFGYEFSWDHILKSATITSVFYPNTATFWAGKAKATHDQAEITLASPATIKSGRLFLASVDMDAISKRLGLQSGMRTKSGVVSFDTDKSKIKYRWNDFTRPILNGDGRNLTLSKVLAEPDTKAVIVQVWHTACAGCVDVLKLFQRLWTKHQGNGLKIVSINTDGIGFEAGRDERIDNAGITYEICSDPEYKLKPDWYDPVFPNYYLIVPGEKYIKIFQEGWDEKANADFEKAVDSLCSPN